MSTSTPDRIIDTARAVEVKLRAEARHEDAEALRALLVARASARTTNQALAADMKALRDLLKRIAVEFALELEAETISPNRALLLGAIRRLLASPVPARDNPGVLNLAGTGHVQA